MIANKSHKLFTLGLILTLNKQASSERRIYEKIIGAIRLVLTRDQV